MTLRELANSSSNPYSMNEWMDLARNAGVSADADAQLTADDIVKIRDYNARLVNRKKEEQNNKAKKEAASARNMQKLVESNYVFIDTSCLMAPASEIWFKRIVQILKNNSKKINMPYSVLTELLALGNDESDHERSELAKRRLELVDQLINAGYVLIRKGNDDSESSASRDLITYCSHFRMQSSLLVITQDEKLAADLLALNHQRSAKGYTIFVKKVNKYGYLSNTIDSQKASKPFRICTKVRPGGDHALPVSCVPEENDMVYASPDLKGEIRLLSQVGAGGEGMIYKTNTPYVAKIYKKECCTIFRLEKLYKMIAAGLQYEGICFPIGILYNQFGEFVGYLMPEAKGYSIQSSIFRKPLFLKKLPGWKKVDLVQCAITILYQIKYLHDNNILIGDINPNNFLVVSPTEVYLVDTDSFQINDLPCPVGFPLFTAPEIHMRHKQGKFSDYSEILRTPENEYFAVATLMFMLMLPGKPPYTQQGGEDIVDNILEMHFPYAVGERRGENVPDGTWRFIWSHLTRRMKENFFRVFNKDDANSEFNIKERLTVEQWKKEMNEYKRILLMWKEELEKNIMTLDADPMSLELYPNALKRQRGINYIKCKSPDCSAEYPEGDPRMKAGFCPECQKKGTPAKCYYCNKTFTFTNYEKYFRKLDTVPLLCPECRKKKNEIVYRQKCSTPWCNNFIELSVEKVAYYKKKNEPLPTECSRCERRKKTLEYSKPESNNTYSSRPDYRSGRDVTDRTSGSTDNTKKKSSGSKGCFITTAVCCYLGKSDDCTELTEFRKYRDEWLLFQPDGQKLVNEYYKTAPELVHLMHLSPDYEEICQTLWDEFLVPCYCMILKGQYEECKVHYVKMVHYLKDILNVQSD